MNKSARRFWWSLVVGTAVCVAVAADEPTPVARWGALQVRQGQLTSATGDAVQLRGLSLFDTTSYGQFASPETLTWLRDDWKVTVFRAALYTRNAASFVGEGAYKGVEQAVDAAIAAGLYVVIDWHILSDGNPQQYADQAQGFFDRMVRRYQGVPNVLYEICNEPNGGGVTWEGAIKPYAERIIPVLRAVDPRAVVIVGNPQWSSQPQLAAANPLGFDNVLYTHHMYVASHPRGFLGNIDAARSAGVGVFVTEWGTTEDSGNSALSPDRAWTFARALSERRISWAAWALGTKLEASSMLKPNASLAGGWALGDLTDNGLLLREILRDEPSGPVAADNFESGNFKAGGWAREGVYLDHAVALGGSSVRFEGQAALRKVLASEGARQWSFSFQARGSGWSKADRFVVEWSNDGRSWTPALTLTKPSADWTSVTGTLPDEARGTAVQWRLRSALTSEAARFYVDDVVVSATRG